MKSEAFIKLSMQVSAENVTEDDIDLMARQLLAELRHSDVESAELAQGGPVPKGAKGNPTTVGSIMVTSLPATLPAVVTVVQAWASRSRGSTVKIKSPDLEFEGSPEELQKFLVTLQKRKGET